MQPHPRTAMSTTNLDPLADKAFAGHEPDTSNSLVAGDKSIAVSPSAVKPHVLSEDGAVPDWSTAAYRLEQRVQSDGPHTQRFGGDWAKGVRARLLGADETAREWVAQTTLLTLTGDYCPAGDPLPPVSFLQALKSTQSAVRAELSTVLDDHAGQAGVVATYEAHSSGYPHRHLLVYSDSEIDSTAFEPVLQAHTAGPVASESGHGAGAVSINTEPTTSEPTGGIAYIVDGVPGVKSVYESDGTGREPAGVVDESESRTRMAAVLDATATQAVRVDGSLL